MRVKSIGTLGVIARRQGAVDVNKAVGHFLLGILQALPPKGDTTADAAIEALNAFYDIYADAEFDYDAPVFVACGFFPALKGVVPAVKNMVGIGLGVFECGIILTKAIDKRKQRDLRLRADEALENLTAFIKYKESERKKARLMTFT
ncbi:hypothetical protein BC938DRAFT_480258, partial [Jimgerdemannia flammicorona]